MPSTNPDRPALTPNLSAEEFGRWYWLKDELIAFAQLVGVHTTGGKELLASRIAAKLDGREFTEPPAPAPRGGRQLAGRLSSDTVIPAGQRCSQVVRAWMTERLGNGFHFDAEMRAFFASSDGTRTMQDALDHWHATRGRGSRSIDPQFEYNRFTRTWYENNPAGRRDELLTAWRDYCSKPIGERERA